MNKRLTRISKYMSFILCHESASIGLKLDTEGWSSVQEFVEKANATGKSVTAEQVLAVVAENDKQRFELSEDGSSIRAVKVSRKATRTATRKETRQAVAKPKVPKPEIAKPEVAKPEVSKPDAPKQAKLAAPGKPVFSKSRLIRRSKSS